MSYGVLVEIIVVEQIIELVVEVRVHALLRLSAELEVRVRADLVDLHVVVSVQVRKHLVCGDLLLAGMHLGRFVLLVRGEGRRMIRGGWIRRG